MIFKIILVLIITALIILFLRLYQKCEVIITNRIHYFYQVKDIKTQEKFEAYINSFIINKVNKQTTVWRRKDKKGKALGKNIFTLMIIAEITSIAYLIVAIIIHK